MGGACTRRCWCCASWPLSSCFGTPDQNDDSRRVDRPALTEDARGRVWEVVSFPDKGSDVQRRGVDIEMESRVVDFETYPRVEGFEIEPRVVGLEIEAHVDYAMYPPVVDSEMWPVVGYEANPRVANSGIQPHAVSPTLATGYVVPWSVVAVVLLVDD